MEQYYNKILNEYKDFLLRNLEVTTADKILKNLDVTKPSRADQISAKFFKDGTPVMAIHHANNINLSVKLDNFISKRKICV